MGWRGAGRESSVHAWYSSASSGVIFDNLAWPQVTPVFQKRRPLPQSQFSLSRWKSRLMLKRFSG